MILLYKSTILINIQYIDRPKMAINVKIVLLSMILLSIVQCTIIITQPALNNFPNNQVEYWFANFGAIHYNKPMSFSLFPTNSTLCGTDADKDKENIKPFTTPTYIVARQSNCSFPKMASQAQLLGAQGIIIGTKDWQYSQGDVIISDDGTGRKVKIVTLFVKGEDFDKLSNLTNAKIKVNFQLAKRDKSSIQLFLSSSGRQNYIFLRNFRQYYNTLQDKIKLNVVYHTIQCKSCDESQCILQGNCCTFDLDNYKSGMGRFIINEQFRQQKIFMYFSQKNQTDKWFEYMDRFDKRCDYDWANSEQCSKNIQDQLGIKQLSLVNEFDLMTQWRRSQVKTGITSLPDISVNGMRHVETLNAQSAFQMICQSLSSQPEGCNNQVKPAETNKAPIIAAVIISSIVFVIGGIFCYRKIIRRQITNDMSSKVNELVAKYAAKVSQQKKRRKDKLMERMTEQI